MKRNTHLIALGCLLLSVGAQAAPFLAVGDGAELFVTGSVGVRHDDNVYTSTNFGLAPGAKSNVISDTIYSFAPALELDFGKNSAVKGSLILTTSFLEYNSNSNLKSNLFSGDLSAGYDDGKTKLNGSAGYHELNQNTVDLRNLTRRNQTNVGGSAEISVSDKTSISGGVSYDQVRYRKPGNSNSETTTLPLNIYYKATPKVDLSIGYRYRDTQEQLGSDSNDQFYNVGARGEFTPKVSGSVNVGYNQRHAGKGGNFSGLGLDSSLNLAFTDKFSGTVGLSKDYSTTPAGAQQENTSVNGGLNWTLTDQLHVGATASYRKIDYFTREDDFYTQGLNAGYTLNSYINLNASYTHTENQSVLKTSEFKNNVYSLGASFRY